MFSEIGPHCDPSESQGWALASLWPWGRLSSALQPPLSTPAPSLPGTPFPLLQPPSANLFPSMVLLLVFPPTTLQSQTSRSCAQEAFSSQSVASYSECQPTSLPRSTCIVSLIPHSGIWWTMACGDSNMWRCGQWVGWAEIPLYTGDLEDASQEVQLGGFFCLS